MGLKSTSVVKQLRWFPILGIVVDPKLALLRSVDTVEPKTSSYLARVCCFILKETKVMMMGSEL